MLAAVIDSVRRHQPAVMIPADRLRFRIRVARLRGEVLIGVWIDDRAQNRSHLWCLVREDDVPHQKTSCLEYLEERYPGWQEHPNAYWDQPWHE
jgi:hypothetical protein